MPRVRPRPWANRPPFVNKTLTLTRLVRCLIPVTVGRPPKGRGSVSVGHDPEICTERISTDPLLPSREIDGLPG